MIKFEHTVFALPFALISALLATHGLPERWKIVWILTALISARSAAMAFNRIVDYRFDKHNPRTKGRALVTKTLSMTFAIIFTVAMSIIFIASAWLLNPICFYLSFPTLAVLLLYSYTKRFTSSTHLILGFAIGLAPLGSWLAVNGTFALPPVLLGFAVMFWIAGFDIMYACQDLEFDRQTNLFSLPSRYGIKNALRISSWSHTATIALLLVIARETNLGIIAYTGILTAAVILYCEHRIVSPNDLSRVNVAFFNLNGYVSLLLLVTFTTDILIT